MAKVRGWRGHGTRLIKDGSVMAEARAGKDGGAIDGNENAWAAVEEGNGKEGVAKVEFEDGGAKVGNSRVMADVGVF